MGSPMSAQPTVAVRLSSFRTYAENSCRLMNPVGKSGCDSDARVKQ